jgi:DNA-binding beta-propeller fold protein YncE
LVVSVALLTLLSSLGWLKPSPIDRLPVMVILVPLAFPALTEAGAGKPFLVFNAGAYLVYLVAVFTSAFRWKRQQGRDRAVDDARRVARVVGVGRNPQSVALSADGRTAFVPDLKKGTLAVVDVDDRVVRSLIPVGRGAVDALALPDNRRVLVSLVWRSGQLAVVDIEQGRTVGSVAGIDLPRRMALSPDGAHVYVPSMSRGQVLRLDAHTLEITGTCAVDGRPVAVAVSPDSRRLYVAAFWAGRVDVLNTDDLSVVSQLSIGAQPERLAVSPDGALLYVACLDGFFVVVDTVEEKIIETAKMYTEGGVAASADGSDVYYIIDRAKGHLVALRPPFQEEWTVPIASDSPLDLAVRQDGLICIACQSGTLDLIRPGARSGPDLEPLR